MIRIFIIFLCIVFSTTLWAAKPSGLTKPDAPAELYTLKNPVEQAQELLKELGFYEGGLDGVSGPDLKASIKSYQKFHRLKQTGKVSRELLSHLENIGRVRALIKRLDVVRIEKQKEARLALLSDPRTKKLLDEKKEEIADPTRDVTHCFKAPSSQCLLKEAVESSRAVFEDDLRDWALGEILAAQVRAGMQDGAMETASRIKDSRLVIAALTNIAKTHAKEGKLSEALSGLSLIPVIERRLSVLLQVADAYRKKGQKKEVRQTINKILAGAQSIDSLEDRLPLQIEAAEILAFVNTKKALKLLDDISNQARLEAQNGSKVTILRQAASAMANIEYPEWALKALNKLPDDETRVPVLMAATRAFLRKGRFKAARNTLQRISADRYRAVIMADVAMALWKAGQKPEAEKVLDEAHTLANGITLPFAKNYALSQISNVIINMAIDTRDPIQGNKAFTVLNSISDGRLRARGLWDLSNASERYGFSITKANLDRSVTQAMKDIKSKFSRAWILGDLASEHHQTGEIEQARKAFKMGLETAQKLKNPWARSRALAKFGAVINRLD